MSEAFVMYEEAYAQKDLLIYKAGDPALRASRIDRSSVYEKIEFGPESLNLTTTASNYGWNIGPIDLSKYKAIEIVCKRVGGGNTKLGIYSYATAPDSMIERFKYVDTKEKTYTIDIADVEGNKYIVFSTRYDSGYQIKYIELKKQ